MTDNHQEKFDLELRLSAIEYLLAEVFKMTLLDAGISLDLMKQMREATRERLLNDPFPCDDPVLADHAGAEFADRVDALLGRIENLLAASYLKVRREEL